MAAIYSAVIASANFIHTLLTSPLFKASDIGDYESETKILALVIENITNTLYDVDEQQISPFQKGACEQFREAVLDAEDILDRIETLTNKKKMKEVDDMVTRETNCKEICSSDYASIKSLTNKASDVLFSRINKCDEVQNAIKDLNKKLDAVKKQLKGFGLNEPSSRGLSRTLSARESGCQVTVQNIMGRDKDKKEIIKLLSRCSTSKEIIPVVSIVGMGGMGKTTLAQLVYDDKSWQKVCHFEILLWVPDSKKLDLKSLLKSILKSICPSDTSLNKLEEHHLKDQLVKEINGKKFLLVLDDFKKESPFSWESLLVLLSKGNKEGSRVLVTTRSRMVAVIVGSSDSTYQLKGRSEEDSLQLFERYAFKRWRDENFVEIGKLIVKKCAGVPLALKVIGALLSQYKDKHKWERVRDYGLTKVEDKVMPILKMSFDDLDPISKQCFSYCALFPKNYRISQEELCSILMANVRFKTNKKETLRDICDEKLKLLFDRCFLEVEEREKWDGDDTHYKMHDLMHDLAEDVAGAEMVVVDSNKLIIEENVRHLSFRSHPRKYIGTSMLELKGRRLRTFMGYGVSFTEQPLNADKLVSDCPFLRFLDFRGRSIGNITNAIGKLIHLRYLNLSNGGFETLDSITELINLQYLINLRCLKLDSCQTITSLPSEIGGLTSLEVLGVSNCFELKELPKDIQRLANLRRLKLESCVALTHLPSEIGGLKSLEVLDVSYCDELKELPMGIEKLTNLKDLIFNGCEGLTQMPSGMGALLSVCRPKMLIVGHPESKHSAQLEELASVSELIQRRLEIQLPNNITSKTLARDGDAYLVNKKSLRELEIKWKKEDNTEEEEEVPTNHMDILAKLQPPPDLEDFNMEGYQGITFPAWVPKDDFGSVLPNLMRISIMSCDRCRNLPAISRLPRLKYIELMWLSSLEYIEEDVSATPFFPSLESVDLSGLPKLKGWCLGGGLTTGNGEKEQMKMLPSFPRLRGLRIGGCPNLKVEPILVSFVKVFSVKGHQVEKESSDKGEETMSSSGTPPALSSSSLGLFVEICRGGG